MKPWEKMTSEEKLDCLRAQIEAMINRINHLSESTSNAGNEERAVITACEW
jgi:hypothetical protein